MAADAASGYPCARLWLMLLTRPSAKKKELEQKENRTESSLTERICYNIANQGTGSRLGRDTTLHKKLKRHGGRGPARRERGELSKPEESRIRAYSLGPKKGGGVAYAFFR